MKIIIILLLSISMSDVANSQAAKDTTKNSASSVRENYRETKDTTKHSASSVKENYRTDQPKEKKSITEITESTQNKIVWIYALGLIATVLIYVIAMGKIGK